MEKRQKKVTRYNVKEKQHGKNPVMKSIEGKDGKDKKILDIM